MTQHPSRDSFYQALQYLKSHFMNRGPYYQKELELLMQMQDAYEELNAQHTAVCDRHKRTWTEMYATIKKAPHWGGED